MKLTLTITDKNKRRLKNIETELSNTMEDLRDGNTGIVNEGTEWEFEHDCS
jgi:hypothetical protein